MVCSGENCSSCKYLEFQISLSLSTSLQSEAQTEKYKDLRALLQLLTNICSKDLVHLFRTSAVRCVSICWFPGPTFFWLCAGWFFIILQWGRKYRYCWGKPDEISVFNFVKSLTYQSTGHLCWSPYRHPSNIFGASEVPQTQLWCKFISILL